MFGFPIAPRTDDFQLQQNLLRTVVFQIKFAPNFGILARKAELEEALAESFPVTQALNFPEISVEFVDQTPIVSTQQGNNNSVVFQSTDQQKLFTVKEDELTLTILGPQYINFQSAQQDLQASIYKVASLLGVTTLTRTAIRKINLVNYYREHFNFPNEAIFRSVFHNLLTLTSSSIPAAPYLFSGISNYRFHHDAHRLNLVYGLLPEPAPDGARQFVLDIDLMNTTPDQPYADLFNSFAAINNEVFNIFSWSINQTLVQSLNSTPASTSSQPQL